MKLTPNSKKMIKLIFSLLISLLFIGLFYNRMRTMDFSSIDFNKFNSVFLVLSILFYIISQWFRSMAWSKGFDTTLHTSSVFQAVCIGNGGNMILPFRMGEVLRVGTLQQLYPEKRLLGNTVFLVAERLLDVFILCCIAVVTTFFIQFDSEIQKRVDFIKGLVGLGIALTPFMLLLGTRLYKKGIFSSYALGRKIEAFVRTSPFKSLKNWGLAFLSLSISWFMVYLSLVLGILSIGSESNILLGALLVLVFTNLGMLIPAAPGGIGVFQYVSIIGLTISSFPIAEASILAILLHLIQYMALIPLATLLFLRLNFKLLKTDTPQ